MSLAGRQSAIGFTTMELLTALLVLGVGVLGIAALYLDRVREQADNPKSIAAELADELATKIGSHPLTEARTPGTDFDNALNVGCETQDGAKETAPAQITACWQARVEERLPNGTGTVVRSTQGGVPIYRVVVSWSEAGVGAASYALNVKARS